MRNLLNPKWLIVINTLPILVLFFIGFGQFNIIKSILAEHNLQLWKNFGVSLGVIGILNFTYSVYSIIKKKNVSVWFSSIALITNCSFIYLFGYYLNFILPFSIPLWMNTGNLFLYVLTFLMLTIIHSLIVLVIHFTPENKEYPASTNFLIAILLPFVVYFISQILIPLSHSLESEFDMHVTAIFFVSATMFFLFFLLRGVFILVTKKAASLHKKQLAWKIPITIIFPLIGLVLNNGYLASQKFNSSDSAIFGDFTHVWFYILAVLNGILVCLPNLENRKYRLFVFFGRSITFAYTLYFFLVFLPFLPLSILAIVVVGVGFLMLTPLLLFVIHINELSKDFIYLKSHFSTKVIVGISLLGFTLIPLFITLSFLNDKRVLNETLTYLYNPDYTKQYEIDRSSLRKTLHTIKGHKDNRNNNDGIFGGEIPYLSSYFNWLVLDNLTLSDAKINTIETVFFGYHSINIRKEDFQKDSVAISHISTRSTFDKSQNAWKTWVDLELTNKSDDNWFSEYSTTLELPEGCWISDYYLYVGNKKEPGILAEKKSAMWIYSQIRNINRDPGILNYLTGNKVAFRVFPFKKNEVRKTGIEFLHKEPIQLQFDSNIVELGNKGTSIVENIENDNVIYISAQQKQDLKSIQRQPYFHFLINTANHQNKNLSGNIKRIEQLLATYKPLSKNAKISFVNSYVTTISINENWKEAYKNQSFKGGFYLDRAIKTSLINAYQSKSCTHPVFVVVTDRIQNAVIHNDFADLKFAFPESDLFYHLDEDGNLNEHSLMKNPLQTQATVNKKDKFSATVLEFKYSDQKVAYLSDNKQPSIVLKTETFNLNPTAIKKKNWYSALNMQGKWTSQILHPEISNKESLNLVKYSFISKVMTPVTSYLVVENEAQKELLKKKQKDVLSGNKNLDLGEDTQRMSEPSLFLLLLLFGIILWYKEKRKWKLKQ